jgi:hypothetical protein
MNMLMARGTQSQPGIDRHGSMGLQCLLLLLLGSDCCKLLLATPN